MQIHEKLKIMRQLKDLTQEELAEKIGYSVNGYAKIERGETDVSLSNLKKIAESYDHFWCMRKKESGVTCW